MLGPHPGGEAARPPGVRGALGGPKGERAAARDDAGELGGGREQPDLVHHPVHEARAQGGLGVDGVAGEDRLHRQPERHGAREPLGAAGAGDEGPAGLGEVRVSIPLIPPP